MRRHLLSLTALGITGLLAGIGAIPMALAQPDQVTYRAELTPLNPTITGTDAYGEALFRISGDDLNIQITMSGVPRVIEHWQHLHGFAEGNRDATCATAKEDANGDRIIDLIETEPVSGTTMLPFNDDPVAMNIPQDSYPTAGDDSRYLYSRTVSLKAMEEAFARQFPGQQLDLDHRVIYVHGVPESTILPASVASLDDIPAQVTLPIACGKIEKVESGTPVGGAMEQAAQGTPIAESTS
jgi:hypothetical protein